MTAQLPDPESDPDLFDGVLTRRVVAYLIDLAIIGILVLAVVVVFSIFGLITLGLGWIALPFAIPISIIIYYGLTLGSRKRATVGMQVMDIVLTPTRGMPLDGWRAFLHPLIFWLTCWILPPFSLLIALFTPRRQLLHDLIVGTMMVRRSPMERHWARYAA